MYVCMYGVCLYVGMYVYRDIGMEVCMKVCMCKIVPHCAGIA